MSNEVKEHEGSVDVNIAANTNYAKCTCGYRGPNRGGYWEANSDLAEHYQRMQEETKW